MPLSQSARGGVGGRYRLKSGMSKRALRLFLDELEQRGFEALSTDPKPTKRARKSAAKSTQIDLEAWLKEAPNAVVGA